MTARTLLVAGSFATALLGLATAASAADKPAAKTPGRDCFSSRDWSNWHAPNDSTIYLKVNLHDIYQVDLSGASSRITWPDSHLINNLRGSDYICSPLDLDLKVSDSSGFPEPLFVKSITKLTPEQIKLIPKKDLP